jgi:septum formation protein
MQLLRAMGLECIVAPSNAEELHDASLPPARLCELNAERKAVDVAQNHPDDLVLGADTLVALEGKVYGKPRDLEEARQMLTELAGHKHTVITGVCLIGPAKKSIFHDLTEVEFKPFDASVITAYLEAVPVLDKAGAYGIQDRGEMLIEKISGSYSNVMGLPVERLALELKEWGLPYNKRSR